MVTSKKMGWTRNKGWRKQKVQLPCMYLTHPLTSHFLTYLWIKSNLCYFSPPQNNQCCCRLTSSWQLAPVVTHSGGPKSERERATLGSISATLSCHLPPSLRRGGGWTASGNRAQSHLSLSENHARCWPIHFAKLSCNDHLYTAASWFCP